MKKLPLYKIVRVPLIVALLVRGGLHSSHSSAVRQQILLEPITPRVIYFKRYAGMGTTNPPWHVRRQLSASIRSYFHSLTALLWPTVSNYL
jgi:hypothetical protein